MSDNNQYPRGKFNADDEGALQIHLIIKDNTLILSFGKDVQWIGFSKEDAMRFSQSVKTLAEQMKGDVRLDTDSKPMKLNS